MAQPTPTIARELGLEPLTPPVRSAQSNGVSESFVKDPETQLGRLYEQARRTNVLQRLAVAFENCNERKPQNALTYCSPREFSYAAASSIERCPRVPSYGGNSSM